MVDEVKSVQEMSYEEVTKELSSAIAEAIEEQPETTDVEVSVDDTTKASEPVAKEEPKPTVADEPDDFKFDETKYREDGWSDNQIELLRKKERQVFEKDKFIARQAHEVGAARKREMELQKKEQEIQAKIAEVSGQKETLKDSFYQDPKAYEQAVFQEMEFKRQQEEIQRQRQELTTKRIIQDTIPEFNHLLESGELIQVVREDLARAGYDQSDIENVANTFKTSWTKMNPQDLVVIGEKAKARARVNELERKVALMSQSPDVIGKKIAQVAGQRPTPRSAPSASPVSRDPSNMSEDEILAELRQLN